MQSLYFDLLQEWCDALISLQLDEIKTPGIYGGIMCPACSRIHGRCADAVYPLMYMAHRTGEQCYLDAAIKLQKWSDHVSSPDGSWVNETEKSWKGITVFGALTLGEAIRHHGMILEKETYVKWIDRLNKTSEFIYNTFTMDTGNINYPITASATLTVAGKVLDNSRFISKGREFAHKSLEYLSENKLIFGEGNPKNGYSPKGGRSVDLGYNVEESLPALVLYGLISGDEATLQLVTESLQAHMDFMLLDGAWDNSWGTRNYKWTYWGSRTSDGCQTAYALMSDYDPRFAEVSWRNTKLLKACTHNGILYGGPHYYVKGELPCIHHTFCHAKALAIVLDYFEDKSMDIPTAIIPRDETQYIKEYPEISTLLVAKGPWRATITSYDWEYVECGHSTGGALSMLWNKDLGPITVASMTEYNMVEPANMQRQGDSIDMPLTPRLELIQNKVKYRNISDKQAVVTYDVQEHRMCIKSSGRLVNGKQEDPPTGEAPFHIEYIFKDDRFEVNVKCDANSITGDLRFYIPIISDRTEKILQEKDKRITIIKREQKLAVNASLPIVIRRFRMSKLINYI
jgi:hypothetical protein